MLNPFKKIRATVKKKFGKDDKTKPSKRSADYRRCCEIWPEGTWKMPISAGSYSDMDLVVCSVIYDVWARQNFLTAQAAVDYDLNPGMFGGYAEPMPPNWYPSEKLLKMTCHKHGWRVDYMHYMVGELTNLKHINP